MPAPEDYTSFAIRSGQITFMRPAVFASHRRPLRQVGVGYLAGTYPNGVTSVEGVPAPVTVTVRARAPESYFDGFKVAEVLSAADGSWRVDGLSPAMRFDVVCRHAGYNDLILSDITPAVD